ncbi:MAG: FxsA family protein [Piscirickettsiaceae bacterium]|jgi:UPF0716 protein FxsA|nr:FxsA family protein [Piscirickettsiaceae bacterium]
MFRFLFLLFLIVPLIEIYFLIQVGEVIGAGWTIFLVVATAVIGAGLLRMQGLSTMQRAQLTLAQGQVPALAMMEGLALLISGGMLLTPGFFTDALGFLLLISPVRQALIKRMMANGQFSAHSRTGETFRQKEDGHIIEGEVVDNNDEDRHLK